MWTSSTAEIDLQHVEKMSFSNDIFGQNVGIFDQNVDIFIILIVEPNSKHSIQVGAVYYNQYFSAVLVQKAFFMVFVYARWGFFQILFLFLPFFSPEKCIKIRFRPGFGVCSTQTLVKIYNTQLSGVCAFLLPFLAIFVTNR